eukprot:jgi/Picre1/33956/NNA_001434.t1
MTRGWATPPSRRERRMDPLRGWSHARDVCAWCRRLVPLTLWRPPVTRREDAFMAPWYGSPHATATCPVAYHNGRWTRDAVAGEGCEDTDESIYVGCTLLAERTWAWHVGEENPDHPPDSVLTRMCGRHPVPGLHLSAIPSPEKYCFLF